MKSIIVDDNSIERETIAFLASRAIGVEVLAEFSNAEQAYEFLQETVVDVVFLDIEMPGMTGLELAKNLAGLCPAILFITSKKDYAIEAFELKITDYLLKPLLPARFLQALDRVRSLLFYYGESQRVNTGYIFLKEGNISKRVNLEDIYLLEAYGDYVKVHIPERFLIVHATLKSLEMKLPRGRFLRIHRSYIIALDKVDYLQDSTLRMCDRFVPVAETYRKNLFNHLPQF